METQLINVSDEEIVEGLISEKREACEHLFKKYNQDIYNNCQKLNIPHEDIIEIINDVFFAVISNIDKYSPQKAKLRTWICTIAKNKAIDFIRKNTRRKEVLRDNEFWEIQADAIKVDNNLILKAEEAFILDKILEKLSDREREVMKLALEGFDHRYIAEELDIEYGNVKTIYSRALKKAKNKYNKIIDEGVENGKAKENG